jgi:hypothetical protein
MITKRDVSICGPLGAILCVLQNVATEFWKGGKTSQTPKLWDFLMLAQENASNNVNRTGVVNISTGAQTTANIVNIGNSNTNNQTLNLNSKTIHIGDTTVPSSVNVISLSIFTGLATFNGRMNLSRIGWDNVGVAVFTTDWVIVLLTRDISCSSRLCRFSPRSPLATPAGRGRV